MDIRTFAELSSPDERAQRFTQMGLSLGGLLDPEEAARFQQRSIASADLLDTVADSVRASFERIRTCHAYGVLCYDLYTTAIDLSWPVLEEALRERLVEFYGALIPVGRKSGETNHIAVRDATEFAQVFWRGGRHAKQGWLLRPTTTGPLIPIPASLKPLMEWARRERLLDGQRNKRMVSLLADMRNRVAHGAGFHLYTPSNSARHIHDLAEIINRLWGSPTPGGSLFPAPLDREVVAVGWSQSGDGLHLTQIRPDQIPEHLAAEGGDWTFLLLLAVPADDLWAFDSRYELTTFPCDLLWGPGDGHQALAWWDSARPEGDKVEHLDRLFALRVTDTQTYPPQRPDVVLQLPADHRVGLWHLIRADYPTDSFQHMRHQPDSCTDNTQRAPCPIEEVATGPWDEIRDTLFEVIGSLRAHHSQSDAHVPRQYPFPATLGYDYPRSTDARGPTPCGCMLSTGELDEPAARTADRPP